MNTKNSVAQVTAFNSRTSHSRRRVLDLEHETPHAATTIFPLLCPSRECDWIPGWTADLIYTESGYAEENCIFSTEEPNAMGRSVWVVCTYDQDRRLEFVRLLENVVYQLKITLTPLTPQQTHMSWQITLTSLNAEGDRQLEALPEPALRFAHIMRMLDCYLDTGEMLSG